VTRRRHLFLVGSLTTLLVAILLACSGTSQSNSGSGSEGGGGGNGPTQQVAKFFYDPSGYRIDEASGALTPLPANHFGAQDVIGSKAVHPSQNFVYFGSAGARGSGDNERYVGAYRVDASSGALTPIAQNNVLGVHAFSLAMHPSGKFLYAADWNSSIAGFTIDSNTGALTPNPNGSVPVPTFAAQFVAMAPSGKFLYLGTFDAGSANGRIVTFQVDSSTGALSRLVDQPTAQFRQGMVSADGKFLVSTGRVPEIAVFQLDSTTGSLIPEPPSANASVPIPGPLGISGRFVYIGGNPVLEGFKINDDGSLSGIPSSPFPTGRQVCDVGIDNGSTFLFAPEVQDDVSSGPQPIHVFRIDSSNGSLTEVSVSPFPPDPQVPQMGCVAAVAHGM